jgi:hypothetical protein
MTTYSTDGGIAYEPSTFKEDLLAFTFMVVFCGLFGVLLYAI